MKSLSGLIGLLFLLAAPVANAASTTTRLTPTALHQGGFAFDIRATRNAKGSLMFRMVVTAKEGRFSRKPDASLSLVEETKNSLSIRGDRTLTTKRRNNTLTCVFTTSEKSINNPNLHFVFTNYVEVMIDGKLTPMPSADMFVARLKDFAPPKR